MTNIQKAVRDYRRKEKLLRGYGMKPNLSYIARLHKVAKSSLWYSLQK